MFLPAGFNLTTLIDNNLAKDAGWNGPDGPPVDVRGRSSDSSIVTGNNFVFVYPSVFGPPSFGAGSASTWTTSTNSNQSQYSFWTGFSLQGKTISYNVSFSGSGSAMQLVRIPGNSWNSRVIVATLSTTGGSGTYTVPSGNQLVFLARQTQSRTITWTDFTIEEI